MNAEEQAVLDSFDAWFDARPYVRTVKREPLRLEANDNEGRWYEFTVGEGRLLELLPALLDAAGLALGERSLGCAWSLIDVYIEEIFGTSQEGEWVFELRESGFWAVPG